MKNSALSIGTKFENDTYYSYHSNIMDVYLTDAYVIKDSSRYTALHGSHIELAVAFYLKNLKNVTLDFCGATLIVHGKMNAFILDNCENVTIKNVIIKYDRSFFTECDLLELSENHMRLFIDKNKYPYQIDGGYMKVYGDFWENCQLNSRDIMFFQAFDRENRDGIGLLLGEIGKEISWPENAYCAPVHFIPEQDGSAVILHGKVPKSFVQKVGAYNKPILVISHESRDYSGILMIECTDTKIENVRFLNGPGMGISPIHCKGLYIYSLKFTCDELSEGIVTNHADAIHAVACSGDIIIEDSFIEGMIDDAINVHNNFYQFVRSSENIITAKAPDTSINALCQNFLAGDEIAVYNGPTLEVTETYTITKTEVIDDSYIRFYVDKPIACHTENDIIENLSAQPDITIKNSVFGKANTHMRFQSRGKIIIENCDIELPVLLTGDASYWLESSPINDMTVKNCRFTTKRAQIKITPEILPTKKAPYYHQNIKFYNNTFVSEKPIVGGYVDNLVFKDNAQVDAKSMTITLKNSGKVDADCEVIQTYEEKTQLRRN